MLPWSRMPPKRPPRHRTPECSRRCSGTAPRRSRKRPARARHRARRRPAGRDATWTAGAMPAENSGTRAVASRAHSSALRSHSCRVSRVVQALPHAEGVGAVTVLGLNGGEVTHVLSARDVPLGLLRACRETSLGEDLIRAILPHAVAVHRALRRSLGGASVGGGASAASACSHTAGAGACGASCRFATRCPTCALAAACADGPTCARSSACPGSSARAPARARGVGTLARILAAGRLRRVRRARGSADRQKHHGPPTAHHHCYKVPRPRIPCPRASSKRPSRSIRLGLGPQARELACDPIHSVE